MHTFRSATAKLTAWYVLVLVVLCLLFSSIVFTIARQEIGRPYHMPGGPQMDMSQSDSYSWEGMRAERLEEGSKRLAGNLLLFNIVILTAGGIASYFFARWTLEPIEEMLDAQIRFSSDAAHELRTPLSVMRSEIEVALRDKKAGKDSYAAILRSNLDEVGRLESLTNRLLQLASGKQVPLSPTSLEDIAIDAVNRAIPQAQAKHITIDNTVSPQTVYANTGSLTDVVTILLDNAIKYCPEGSHITLANGHKGRMAHLSVADNGPGISPEAQKHVFERFYREDTSRTSHAVKGHGLGLSIAQSIMAAHKGSIEVHSTPGEGTVFVLHVPLAAFVGKTVSGVKRTS